MTGTTHFKYNKLGQITKVGNEVFAFNSEHNILSDNNSPNIQKNRLKEYNGSKYYKPNVGRFMNQDPIGLFDRKNFTNLH